MTEEFETPETITDDDKLWALLSWVFAPIVPIIVLLLEDKKNRSFIRYHGMHGLVAGIIGAVASGILGTVIPCIGFLIGPVIWVYFIYLGIQAYNGNWVQVPVLTDFIKKQGWI
jgi:uncharacterized membrane protein